MRARNRILAMLPRAEYLRLEPALEHVELGPDMALTLPGALVSHVYFPDDAVVSLLCRVKGRRMVEITMEGNEAAVGVSACFGKVRSSNPSVVRDAGTAMRLDVVLLRRHLGKRGQLQELLYKSAHATVTQVAQLAVCNRFHGLDARLARWLLMTRDRLGSLEIQATHESIAGMLGVRRSGVTASASAFQRKNLIDYNRGRIEIVNQRGLRAASCSCYGLIKSHYDGFLRAE